MSRRVTVTPSTPTAASAGVTCPDDATVAELVEGLLDAAARAPIEQHLAGCRACRQLVAELARGASPPSAEDGVSAAPSFGPGDDADFLPQGAQLGRYVVLARIGAGGAGVVYAAYDPELDRRVAIKLLRGSVGAGQERLLREAKALAKLSHKNVVAVHDLGILDGRTFIAMDYVAGSTLRGWLRERPRAWQEILGAFREAGHGLLAAHRAGLVHRDFKPDNVLVRLDGHVCVTDFGLARADLTSDPGRQADASGAALTTLTQTGELVGTPAYMAPEQFAGRPVDARTDQFAFAVALFEALYGARPFPGATLGEIAKAVAEGKPCEIPAAPEVPAWARRAVLRGLALRPEDRFPSMGEMLAALEPPSRPGRGRGLAVAAGGVAVAVAIAAARWGTLVNPCAHPERQLAGAWDEDVRGRVRVALRGTGLFYADDTARRVADLLDRYTASWTSMRREVCEDGRSGKQRREIVAMRDACLDRRLGQVQALTATLTEKVDGAVVNKAVEAAAGLPSLGACADVEALTVRVRPPEDPETRARVAALEPRVDRLEALYWAGKFQEGLRDGEALVTEVGTLDYAPLRARVQLLVGGLRKGAGDKEGAKTLLRSAAVSAALGRDEELSARAWADLLLLVTAQRRMEEAAVIRGLAPTAVGRTADVETQSRWANAEGVLLWRMGDLAEAKTSLERAVSLRIKVLGPDHPQVATSVGNLAIVAGTAGEYAEARSLFEQAVAIREKAQGPDHPETTVALTNLAATLSHMGEYAQAVAVDERVLAVLERTRGTDNDDFGFALATLGEARSAMGDFPGAVALCTRALAIREKALGPDHPSVASVLANLGHARARLGQLDAARPLLERALAVREKAEGASHADLSEPLLYLGDLALARGAPADAEALLERALALHNADTESEVQLTLAEALWRVGKDRPRARTLAEKARSRYEHIGHRPGSDRAARWLAEHPLVASTGGG